MNKIVEVIQGPWMGMIGEVVEVGNVLKIRTRDGKKILVNLAHVIEVEARSAVSISAEHPADFSHSGLGIGGINGDQSIPVIPSVEAIERVQRMHDTDVVCRRCGASKNFDGAMFTTGGGGVCDDCF